MWTGLAEQYAAWQRWTGGSLKAVLQCHKEL